MEEFEIYFEDLTEEAQKRFLVFMGFKDESDGNYDVFPIASIPKPEDDDDDEDDEEEDG